MFKLAFFYVRVYAFFGYYRKKARREEMERKFRSFLGERWNPGKGKKIVRHVFELRGTRKVMHYLIPLVDRAFIKRFVEIEGIHFLDEAIKKGRGVVLMGGHFGLSHLSFHSLKVMGYDWLLIKGGAPKNRGHRRFRYSENVNDTIFIYDRSLAGDYRKRILETLRSGRIIIYYGDTREGKWKERVHFLGKEVDFPAGVIHLAHETKASIIPFIHLYWRGKITMIFKEPIDHGWKEEAGYRRIVSEYAKIVETYLLLSPEQYMGIYGPTVIESYYRSCVNGTVPSKEGEK